MRFIKMHGIGNDYVYLNGFAQPLPDERGLSVLATQMADRHTGVGGDGLIAVLPPASGVEADVRMRMFNADGSESEMCGNGVRCVCKLAYDHEVTATIRKKNPMLVQTGRGVLSLAYVVNAAGKVEQVTVDMAEPILSPAQIPVGLSGLSQVVDYPAGSLFEGLTGVPANWEQKAGLEPRMTCVSMGNPHVVFYVRDVQAVPLEVVGPVIERHGLFPRRINVHFVQVISRQEVVMRTWERGSGITLACGTGACAVCVAGVLTGRTDRSIVAHLPGGDLGLQWRNEDGHVYMTGPATEVFTGEWPMPV